MNYLDLLKLALPEAIVVTTALAVLAVGLASKRGAGKPLFRISRHWDNFIRLCHANHAFATRTCFTGCLSSRR